MNNSGESSSDVSDSSEDYSDGSLSTYSESDSDSSEAAASDAQQTVPAARRDAASGPGQQSGANDVTTRDLAVRKLADASAAPGAAGPSAGACSHGGVSRRRCSVSVNDARISVSKSDTEEHTHSSRVSQVSGSGAGPASVTRGQAGSTPCAGGTAKRPGPLRFAATGLKMVARRVLGDASGAAPQSLHAAQPCRAGKALGTAKPPGTGGESGPAVERNARPQQGATQRAASASSRRRAAKSTSPGKRQMDDAARERARVKRAAAEERAARLAEKRQAKKKMRDTLKVLAATCSGHVLKKAKWFQVNRPRYFKVFFRRDMETGRGSWYSFCSTAA